MTSRRELKNYAKQAMSGKYGILILAFVAVQALALISSMISTALFPGEETIDIVLSYAFTFILTLLINVVAAGMNYMYLNIARGKAYSLNDLFYFYRHHPDRVICCRIFHGSTESAYPCCPIRFTVTANLPGKRCFCGGADYLAVYRCCSDDRGNDCLSDSGHSSGDDLLYSGR